MSWLSWTPNQNTGTAQRPVLVLQDCPLAAGFCRVPEGSNLLGCYFAKSLWISAADPSLLQFSAQPPLFPALGHLLCPWTWVFHLQWFSPMSSLWGHGVQPLCCPPFAMSWPGFLPTLRPFQIFCEGDIWTLWFSMEKASPQCPWVRNPVGWEPRASLWWTKLPWNKLEEKLHLISRQGLSVKREV